MGLSPEKWQELRAPFPRESIGKLPKPYKADSPRAKCNECGGYHGMPAAHLDYVGHAVITNRLNNVDPDWNWTPMSIDAAGHPSLDAEKNLWIWLTIGDKTIPAVGDGKNMKERIGDAIRNGAMRFGVALDLWAKDELEDWAIERGDRHQPETTDEIAQAPGTSASIPADNTPTVVQNAKATAAERKLVNDQAVFYGFRKEDKAQVMAVLSRIAGREIKGTADLTSAEAKKCAELFVAAADEIAGEAIQSGLGGFPE